MKNKIVKVGFLLGNDPCYMYWEQYDYLDSVPIPKMYASRIVYYTSPIHSNIIIVKNTFKEFLLDSELNLHNQINEHVTTLKLEKSKDPLYDSKEYRIGDYFINNIKEVKKRRCL
jgi:hypothetical protein